MKKSFLLGSLLVYAVLSLSQNSKIPLDHSIYEKWKKLERPQISNNGRWVSYEINPQKGDGWLYFYNTENGKTDSFHRAGGASFSPYSDYAAFRIKPFADSIRKMMLNKVPKDKLPKDTLAIFVFGRDSLIRIPDFKSYMLAKQGSDWMVYHLEKKNKKEKESPKDTIDKKAEDKNNPETAAKQKKIKDQPGTTLVIYNPIILKEFRFADVEEYLISEKGTAIAFRTLKRDSLDSNTIFVFYPDKMETKKIDERTGSVKNLAIDEQGSQIVFLVSNDTTKNKVYSLCYWSRKSGKAKIAVDRNSSDLKTGWSPSVEGKIYFSSDGSKLFFGVAPKPENDVKDTLTEDEKVRVDIWNWKDKQLQSQQLFELNKEQKRTYLAVYFPNNGKIFQLGDPNLKLIKTTFDRNADFVAGFDNEAYQDLYIWESARYFDAYLIDLKKGEKKQILIKKQFYCNLSNTGKYLLWYDDTDSNWYSMNTANGKKTNLTGNMKEVFCEEDHDTPNEPDAYGLAGWSTEDRYVLIYDRYDIWKFDPEGKEKPQNITKGLGRKTNTTFRYIHLDRDNPAIDLGKQLTLHSFNEKTKQEGYHSLILNTEPGITELVSGDFAVMGFKKAKDANVYLWQKSTVSQYQDLWLSKGDFVRSQRISYAGTQQNKYLWPTVERTKWLSFDGKELEGLIYKPENFDSSRKYPLIVYFYEKSSDDLHNYWHPGPSRSTVSPSYYCSNGYIIFMPDIPYTLGYPGQSAYNAIVSGTMSMIDKGYIDKNRIGLQGQSWGGYQVAYLVTRTNLYKAAMAGAAVSNMTSAYSGIRGESGISRAFQYEDGQSRIGASLWEKPLLYFENSPLFYADRINTPLLMMNNDNDGAVPWTQGIELYTALKRMNKPVWLLNYNGDQHNLDKWPNRVDLSIRMSQFFDYYLMNKPMPVWMSQGIPALQKGKTLGYSLEQNNGK